MHHFFVAPEQVQEDQAVIRGGDVNHIRSVLRMKPGEELMLGDGCLQYTGRIIRLSAEEIQVQILERRQLQGELAAKIYLFQGLPKADKMEWIIQKCVELGVYEIVPVAMKRCVVKLDPKKEEAKRKRWQLIAQSAAKQAGRGIIPQIHEAVDYRQALRLACAMQHILVPYEKAGDMEATRRAFAAVRRGESAAVFIGPEGGFEETEIAQAEAAGARAITLGRRILRTETAGMAALAMLAYELEQ